MKISKNHVKSVVERVGSPLDSVKKTSATQPPSTSKRTNRQPTQPEAHLKGVSAQIRLVDSEVHPETPPFRAGGWGKFFLRQKKTIFGECYLVQESGPKIWEKKEEVHIVN